MKKMILEDLTESEGNVTLLGGNHSVAAFKKAWRILQAYSSDRTYPEWRTAGVNVTVYCGLNAEEVIRVFDYTRKTTRNHFCFLISHRKQESAESTT